MLWSWFQKHSLRYPPPQKKKKDFPGAQIKWWMRYHTYKAGVQIWSPCYQQITFLLFSHSCSRLPHIPCVQLFSWLQFAVLYGLNIPIVALFEPATNLYKPHDSCLNCTVAHISVVLHFCLLFPFFLALKRHKQQSKERDWNFCLMFLHSLFWIFSFNKPLTNYLRTRENNFSSNKIGPDPNSHALNKRLLVNSWTLNEGLIPQSSAKETLADCNWSFLK